jgi:hypothetical protein
VPSVVRLGTIRRRASFNCLARCFCPRSPQRAYIAPRSTLPGPAGLFLCLRSGDGRSHAEGLILISIPITDEAYEALKAINPWLDQDQTSRGRNGQLRIWVDRTFLDQLLAASNPGENYSDTILRLARG